MTLGINNGIIIMEADNQYDFEFNMQPYQEQQDEVRQVVDWRVEQRGYHLNKAIKIVSKYYYRTFMGRFKSAVYQMLVQNITKQAQNMHSSNDIDWPYRSLLLKPNKTQHELLQIEFINMCAEKIQSVFKGYLTRKRYNVAFGRVKRFMLLMDAAVKGWKVRRIMRCIKVKQQIKSIQIKKGEVEKTEHNQTNTFNLRRFQYLKNSLKNQVLHFHFQFSELYQTGAWVYEPKIEVVRTRVKKWSDKKQVASMKQNQFNQAQVQVAEYVPQVSQQQVPQKKKRVRQMRNNVRKARNLEENNQQQQIPQNQIKNQSTLSQVTTNTSSDERPIQAKGSYNSNIGEQRPIQAKGAYSFNEESANLPPPKYNKAEQESGQNNTQDEEKKAQLQKIEKKKLQKRQKYDPRKAIEEEKKKKKQQQIKEKQQAKSPMEIPPKPKAQSKSKEENTKSQKNIKMQKEDNNRSTVNLPKNKAKVQAKIDCWGNRKTVANKRNAQEFIKATKIISNNPSEISIPPVDKNIELIPSQKLAAKIHQRRGKEKQKLQYSQQRQKARIEIQKNCEQSERIKQYLQLNKEQQARQSQAAKFLKAQALRQRQKVVQQGEEQKDKRKDAVYRSVAQLDQTYRTQYIARYQNLHPKLNLLAAARNTEQSSRIPVLSLDSDFVERMMEENKLNQRFWYTVSKMERNFKDFIKS